MKDHWRTFNRGWFGRNQKILLLLLNLPVLRIWFRWILRINGERSSLGRKRVRSILPHAIFWLEGGGRTTGEFRTHPKFAKRIYYAFRPIWDLVFAFRVLPCEQDGYIFGVAGFTRRQPLLLYLLNGPLKRWFRYVLRINGEGSSVGDREIVKILPHAIWWKEGGEYHAEFRTHNKFSKRIFFAFRFLWEAMHFWDWLIADRFLPSLSFGFNNYTAYPDPDPETTTVDGQVEHWPTNTTWSALRTGTGTGSFPSVTGPDDAFIIFKTNVSTDVWDGNLRSCFLFDTSPLTASAMVSAGTFSLYVDNKHDYLSASPSMCVVSCAPASNTNLVAGDYDSFGSTEFATRKSYASITTAQYNDYSLNSSGLSALSKTGVTKYGVIEGEYDLDNSTPPWASNTESEINGYFADYTGTANDPKLVVAYTLRYGLVVTAYPDADPETTAVDGWTAQNDGLPGSSWSTLVAAAGNSSSDSVASDGHCGWCSGTSGGQWKYILRSAFLFDTSPISSGATVSSATFSLYGNGKTQDNGDDAIANIYSVAPASNTAIANGDFDSFGTTAYCDTAIGYSAWANSYNDWSMNATGIAAVSKTGVTKIGTRNPDHDVANSAPTWGASDASDKLICYFADQTGETNDPKLVVSYSTIQHGNDASGQDPTGGTSYSISHTLSTASGNNRIVLAGVTVDDVTTTITGCTYNGVSMSTVDSSPQVGLSDMRTYLFYILDHELPASTGSYNIQCSLSQSDYSKIIASEFYGVKQVHPEADAGDNGNDSTTVVNITTKSNSAVVWCIASNGSSSTAWTGHGAGQIQAGSLTGGAEHASYASWKRVASAGATTMEDTSNQAWHNSAVAVSIAAQNVNGFVLSPSTWRYGNDEGGPGASTASAQLHTMPGSGNYEISQIGMYVRVDPIEMPATMTFRMAIWTYDATNDCPEAMVTNSETPELSCSTDEWTLKTYTYPTRPVLTGGQKYMLAYYMGTSYGYIDRAATGYTDAGVWSDTGHTYPTWPTGTQWESANESTEDKGAWAVYSKVGGVGKKFHYYKMFFGGS